MAWLAKTAVAILCAGALSGCATQFGPAPGNDGPPQQLEAETTKLPPMKTFGRAQPQPPYRSNTEIARDFLDLSTKLESGKDLPVFTRFEGPITVGLTGKTTPVFTTELDRLLARIRREAGLNIRQTSTPQSATITVEAITRRELQRSVPNAACFVLPQRVTWAEFRSNPRRRDLNWSDLTDRRTATVFIPADISPQEIRDCLHEEIAQALGPVNDLYRLEDSIFNDDNMHSVLTGFDMLVLRVTYDPALRSGMSRAEVAAALPGILNRLNPAGRSYATRPFEPTTPGWKDAINEALPPTRSMNTRRTAALKALDIAQMQGWQDTRLGLSLLISGKLAAGRDGVFALDALLKAGDVYDSRKATAIHSANVGILIAAFALTAGDMPAAIRISDQHIPAAMQAEDAALLADLLLVKAAALEAQGETAEAEAPRLDGLGWARYGLRSDQAVLRREAEIQALVPMLQEGT